MSEVSMYHSRLTLPVCVYTDGGRRSFGGIARDRLPATASFPNTLHGGLPVCESGPLRAVHVSRHKWPGGLG